MAQDLGSTMNLVTKSGSSKTATMEKFVLRVLIGHELHDQEFTTRTLKLNFYIVPHDTVHFLVTILLVSTAVEVFGLLVAWP
jgi:hypothetical protein